MAKLEFDKIKEHNTPIYIDLRLLRNATKELKEINIDITIDDLIKLAFEKKIVITSSEES